MLCLVVGLLAIGTVAGTVTRTVVGTVTRTVAGTVTGTFFRARSGLIA